MITRVITRHDAESVCPRCDNNGICWDEFLNDQAFCTCVHGEVTARETVARLKNQCPLCGRPDAWDGCPTCAGAAQADESDLYSSVCLFAGETE